MTETSSTHFQTTSSYNKSSLGNTKYGGLIKRSFLKQLMLQMTSLFAYIDNVAPTFEIAHNIISIVRILQLIGPSFCLNYFPNIWVRESTDFTVMNIISFLFQIIPVQFNEEARLIFLIIYSILTFLVLALLVGFSYYYVKNANMPALILGFMSFYFATFAQILHPIAINLAFEQFSDCICNRSIEGEITHVVVSIVSILISIFFFFLIVEIKSRVLTFRPNSLTTLSINSWVLQFFETVIICALINMGSKIEKWGFIFIILAAIVYFASCIIPFYQGGFINEVIQKAMLSTNISCGILCIVNAVFYIMEKKASLLLLFIYIIIWVIVFIIFHFFLTRRAIEFLKLIDETTANGTIDAVKTPNHFINVAKVGFQNAHPSCIDWSFCKLAVGQWPKNQYIWYVFAKFVAIFQEETKVLEWIFFTVCSNHLKGASAKTIKDQCVTITRQRESTLSNDLKFKINKILKQTNSTKHKLRHIWDAVIQGNISEVEDATKRASAAIEQNSIDFQRLLRQYPNNRFVTRPYARFLIELVGDAVESSKMIEKTRLLQRGINVNSDQTHVFGVNSFPNLPDHLVTGSQNQQTQMTNESCFTSSMYELEEENNPTANENAAALKELIDDVKIPAIRNTLAMRYIILFVFFIIPFFVMLIVVSVFIEGLTEPVTYMQSLALVTTLSYQVVAYSHRYAYLRLGVFDYLQERDSDPPQYLGYSWNTDKQTEYLLTLFTQAIQSMNEFRSFKPNDKYIEKAHKSLFEENVVYYFYKSPENITTYSFGLQSALIDFVTQSSTLIKNKDNITPDVINSSFLLNIVGNSNIATDQIALSISYISEYINDVDESFSIIVTIATITITVIIVILYVASLILQLNWIKTNKQSAYMCLISLPKNLISQLSENLRVLKKENSTMNSSTSDNGETSKQEENILKIFNTGGKTGIKLGDIVILIITAIAILALEIACIFVFGDLVSIETNVLLQRSPKLDYVLGSYSHLLKAIYYMNIIAAQSTEYKLSIINGKEYEEKLLNQSKIAWEYYSRVRFGSDTIQPFVGFEQGVKNSAKVVNCTNKYHTSSTYLESVSCFNAAMTYISLLPFFDYLVIPAIEINKTIDSHNSFINDLWYVTVSPIYNAFIAPMYYEILPTIRSYMGELKMAAFQKIIPMMAITILIEFVATIQIKLIQKHIKFVLHLLLLCQSDHFMQNAKISAVLGGDFSIAKNDKSTRNATFFDTVFRNLPESVFYTDSANNIESVNKQCRNLLNCEEEEIIGKPITDILSKFKGETESLIRPIQKVEKDLTFQKNGGEIVYLRALSSICNQKNVIVLQDTTSTVRYNTLIQAEKSKSDQLLSSILPKNLVTRVQAGEKNISFSVQTATIVFMDIVSFTPWCGSLPADQVMMTLNHLFKMFDAIVARYLTMTKIKCIGDCYMAAGGVFAEVNVPAEHAKEVVNFGIDSLDAIRELNKELNQNLQIRVGVNTGGPIVAGVLGIGKPTFEILGPAINMAQQMEHHGVAMNVHITRPVYELVYGDTFNIRERGSIEVKNGTVITYLVSGRK